MEIDFEHSTLRIGIRDFVTFAQSSYPSTPTQNLGNWRTQLGQQWHQQLWQETQEQYGTEAKAEISIEGTISFENWTFRLSGRVDQLLYETDQTIIREIKTTQQILPIALDVINTQYPDYFEQLACYQLLLPTELIPPGNTVVSELLMLHIDTGIRQYLSLSKTPLETLKPRLQRWVDFLEGQRSRNDRVRHLVVPEAFETFREDQIPVRQLMFRELESKKSRRHIALKAATGFGKTSIAIEWALQGIKQGKFERVIYLTGKNTGQQQVVEELRRFRKGSEGIRFFQVRNMDSHIRVCPHPTCICETRLHAQDKPSLESYIPYTKINELIRPGSPDMESIGLAAGAYQVCPRLISQTALAISEFWIADYNYVFAPGARGLLDSIPTFSPERTLLILDEAHNLHDRVCSNFSTRFTTYQGEQIVSALRDVRAPRNLLSCIDALCLFVSKLETRKVLDTTANYQLKDLLDSIHQTLLQNGRILMELPESIVEMIWNLETSWQTIHQSSLETVFWSSHEGSLSITCIQASKLIHSTLSELQSALFMSATFPDEITFEQQTELSPASILRIDAPSEWRNHCYDVAIDTRVNTGFKNREKYYGRTANTLQRLKSASNSAVLAFFPSYRYAETIKTYLDSMAPELRVFTMEQSLAPDDQIEQIAEAVIYYDILCLPLGSGLSEGIDLLGGQIDTVIVVSPALPEVNPVQQAKTERYSNSGDGFRQVYQIPGLTKVNQALGRIVRSPEHRARVLLHCDRFSKSDYRSLLSPEYQNATIIRSYSELESWLTRPNGCL